MRRFTVSGTPFRVLAIDGHDLNGPGLLDRVSLPLAAGRTIRHRIRHAAGTGLESASTSPTRRSI